MPTLLLGRPPLLLFLLCLLAAAPARALPRPASSVTKGVGGSTRPTVYDSSNMTPPTLSARRSGRRSSAGAGTGRRCPIPGYGVRRGGCPGTVACVTATFRAFMSRPVASDHCEMISVIVLWIVPGR